jgi:hypothetical protein
VWDLRLGKRFKTFGKQHVELSADIFNVVNMFDKNEGHHPDARPANLYNLTGFDPVTTSFNYSVNTTRA